MAKIYAPSTKAVSPREERNMARSRAIAAEGMVLLENKGILPIKIQGTVALFGNGGRRTVKGGTGSGDVNSRLVVTVEDGLEAAGFTVVTKDWLTRYDTAVEQARGLYFQNLQMRMATEGMGVIMDLLLNPFREPDIIPVTESDLVEADTAVYVVARNSGEGKDRSADRGDFQLTETEENTIALLAEKYENLVVVLNVGGVMDTRFLRSVKGVGAILLMSQAGNVGGHALADVLTGKVTPSGHLTTTWAEKYEDYPNSDSFSYRNGDLDEEYYNEGIFVGYRYFDTFGIKPAYPFGYGLSYTQFRMETESVELAGDIVTVKVKIDNIGKYAGKAVAQVYLSAPDGRLEKPYQSLAAFGKTKLLASGESETLTLTFKLSDCASYDTALARCILESGTYYVRVGSHSRDTHISAALKLTQTITTAVLENQLETINDFKEYSKKDCVSYTYEGEEAEKKSAPVLFIEADKIPCISVNYTKSHPTLPKPDTDQIITLEDVKAGKYTMQEFVAQLTAEELAELCVGTARGGMGGASAIGAASSLVPGAAGDTTSILLESRKVPNIVLADGPAGLRLTTEFAVDANGDQIPGLGGMPLPGLEYLIPQQEVQIPEGAQFHYQFCTAIPIATLLAQTWDESVLFEAGDIVGGEMQELGVTLWLAPGMNIQRNPLCGRNFEYYSEDPVISGKCAAAETKGVQQYKGIGTCIKHYAFNNQEDNRSHTNANVSERAAREIYLKGFEIAVKESQPLSLMTSYNLVNGTHTANSYDLNTSILRDEWGFEGLVMTDWGTTGTLADMSGRTENKYGASSPSECIRGGNDLIMPGSQEDVEGILNELGKSLTLGDLQSCACHILSVIAQG